MVHAATFVIWVLVPVVLFMIPQMRGTLAQRAGAARRWLGTRLMRHYRRRYPLPEGFRALQPDRGYPQDPRRNTCLRALRGTLLATPVVLLLVTLASWPEDRRDYSRSRDLALLGLAAGIMALWALHAIRCGLAAVRASRLLKGLGMAGVWHGPLSSPRLTRRVLDDAQRCAELMIMDPDGHAALNVLSHPAHPPGELPHPHLAGKRILLLVLPLRSERIDPLRRRSSCAEEALRRIDRTAERHWQALAEIEAIRERWQSAGDVRIELRYLEGRPAFCGIFTPDTALVSPWQANPGHWLEYSAQTGHGSLLKAHLDVFLDAWGTSRAELSFALDADSHEHFETEDQKLTRELLVAGS